VLRSFQTQPQPFEPRQKCGVGEPSRKLLVRLTRLQLHIFDHSTFLDEIGYLPIDQRGADLLFQVISQRYERGSIVLTSNKAFKQWATIFNGDSTITSAVLDRLLHHAETVLIEGSSYRMKDRLES
jgi:hypothetical protein